MQKEPNSLDDEKHNNDSPVANREEECTPLNHAKIPPGAVALPGPQSHQLIQQHQQQQQLHLHPQLQQQSSQQQQQQLLSHHYHANNTQGQRSFTTATSLNHHQQLNLTSNSSTIV